MPKLADRNAAASKLAASPSRTTSNWIAGTVAPPSEAGTGGGGGGGGGGEDCWAQYDISLGHAPAPAGLQMPAFMHTP